MPQLDASKYYNVTADNRLYRRQSKGLYQAGAMPRRAAAATSTVDSHFPVLPSTSPAAAAASISFLSIPAHQVRNTRVNIGRHSALDSFVSGISNQTRKTVRRQS